VTTSTGSRFARTEPRENKSLCLTLYLLAICFSPSLSDSFIFLTLTRLVVVLKFINFRFALFTPHLGDFQKFLSQYIVDRHQKVVNHGETDVASLLSSLQVPNVSKPDDIQPIKHYVDQQQDQIKQPLMQ
jgi:hypothetical protein